MKHVSFSQLKDWHFCAFYHKLVRIDGLKGFRGNTFTAFGNAIHDTCEGMLTEGLAKPYDFFLERFSKVLNELKSDGIEIDASLVEQMEEQARPLVELILPELEEYFGEYEVVSAEELLYEDVEESDLKYKGYIDLVLKTPDGKYHVIDWKSCSWGWNARKRSDPMVTYQLTFYKYFYAKKHGLDPKNVETHFALLKRTAKQNNVEFFRVTSGQIKTNNALNFLNKAIYNIQKDKHVKNRLSCSRCDFYKTEHCP
jgi:RecB family exonuclease